VLYVMSIRLPGSLSPFFFVASFMHYSCADPQVLRLTRVIHALHILKDKCMHTTDTSSVSYSKRSALHLLTPDPSLYLCFWCLDFLEYHHPYSNAVGVMLMVYVPMVTHVTILYYPLHVLLRYNIHTSCIYVHVMQQLALLLGCSLDSFEKANRFSSTNMCFHLTPDSTGSTSNVTTEVWYGMAWHGMAWT
jgi:hypothetical protein